MALYTALLLTIFAVCYVKFCDANNYTYYYYYFSYPPNYDNRATKLNLYITTSSIQDISFIVQTKSTILYDGNVSLHHPVTVTISALQSVGDATFSNREKGISVKANGQVSPTALNTYQINAGFTSGVFRIHQHVTLPLVTEYKYIAVSSGGSAANSVVLIVGCETNTNITIIPSRNVQLPEYLHADSEMMNISSGDTYSFVLNRYDTLLVSASLDLSGTQIISDKPLTVISGHQCGNVPIGNLGCDYLATHIPSTNTLGRQYLLAPLAGRTGGQLMKIVAVHSNTVVQHSCNINTTIINLVDVANVFEFSTASYQSCFLTSDKPVMIAELSFGYNVDGKGDPSLMIVPPVEQYVTQADFMYIDEQNFSEQYATVLTSAQDFNPLHYIMDSRPILSEWSMIFSDRISEVVGYLCHFPLSSGSHTIQYIGSTGKMAILVYGFQHGHGYAYNTGLAQHIWSSDFEFSFSSSHYEVTENNSVISVEVVRNMSTVKAIVHIFTSNRNAMFNEDYQELDEEIVFEVGENYKQVTIIINNDERVEPPEQFIITLVPLLERVTSDIKETVVTIIDDDIVSLGFSDDNTISINSGELQPDVLITLLLLTTIWQGSIVTQDSKEFILSQNMTQYIMSDYTDKMGVATIFIERDINDVSIFISPSVILMNTILIQLPTSIEQSTTSIQQSITSIQQSTTSIQQSTTSIQQSTISIQQSTTSTQQSTISTQQSITSIEQSTTNIEQSTTTIEQSTTSIQQSTTSTQQSTISTQQSITSIEQSTTTIEQSTTTIEQSTTSIQQSTISIQQSTISTQQSKTTSQSIQNYIQTSSLLMSTPTQATKIPSIETTTLGQTSVVSGVLWSQVYMIVGLSVLITVLISVCIMIITGIVCYKYGKRSAMKYLQEKRTTYMTSFKLLNTQ